MVVRDSVHHYGTLVMMLYIVYIHGYELSDVKRLKTELLVNNSYDKFLRPVLNQTAAIQVNVRMAFTSILDFDMTTGKFVTAGYLVVTWTDEQLVWNESDYNSISRLSLASDEIWTPRFVQSNSRQLDVSQSPTWVNSNGIVLWLIGTLFEGNCQLDMQAFPWDIHACVVVIQPSANDASELEINILPNDDAQINFAEHGEWKITDSSTEVLILKEPISGICFTALSKMLKLSRRYVFIFLHTCIPMFLLGALNIIIFLVPLKSGERVTFAVAVLLTFIVSTSDMSDTLPHNSLKISLASVAMTITNCLCTLAVISSVILCRMAYETIMPVPNSLVSLTRKFVDFKKNKCNGQSPQDDEQSEACGEQKGQPDNLNNDENINIDWETVANMFDSILFNLYLIVILVADFILIVLLLVK